MRSRLTIIWCVLISCIANLSAINTAYSVVLISDTLISATNTSYDGQDLIVNGATVTINGTHQFNNVQVINGAVLTHSRTPSVNLEITSNTFYIDASSKIDITGKGRLPTAAVTGTAGGSYGGRGGVFNSSSTTNPVFGDYKNPVHLGIGGLGTGGTTYGGGNIKIVTGTLTVNGSIIAEGDHFNTFFTSQGGGSGGSILLDVGTISGSGTIQASGGSGFTFYGGGGGGGGRVAVYYDSASFNFNNIINEGGACKPLYGEPGQPGTIYIEKKVDVKQPPVANAGVSLVVNEQTDVTLSGSATDADGFITGYAWTQLSGPAVDLIDADTATPYFTTPVVLVADSPTVLGFRLTVTDNDGLTATSDTTVGVLAVNEPPVASAGSDFSVNEDTDVSLNGSGTDSDGNIIKYEWAQTSGTPVVLTNSDSAAAQFKSPFLKSPEVLGFRLTVTDNESAAHSDDVLVTVNPVNTPPVANIEAIGPIAENTTVVLNGSLSSDPDADGFITDYNWTQTGGPAVTIANSTDAIASFIAPAVYQDTILSFRLDVLDDEGGSASANIDVIVYSVNLDDDDDDMPDLWEIEFFNTLDNDGTGDTDNDGASDLDEYNLGTDPTVEQQPGQPEIVSPDDIEVTSLQPELVLTNPAHNSAFTVSYQFEVYSDAAMTDLVTSTTGADLTWSVNTTLQDNTDYYWRARAKGATLFSEWVNSEFFVNTVNDAPGAFNISYPQDGVWVATFTPELSVTNSVDIDKDNITYHFEVYADGILVTSADGILPGADGTTSWTVDVPLAENSWYQWRAIATDEHGLNTTSSSEPMFFVNTFNDAPETPTINTPFDGSEITTLHTDLVVNNSFDAEGEALHYLFELDTEATFDSAGKQSSGIVYETSNVTGWPVSGLADNTWYHWRAKASDGRAESAWVNGRFFVNQFNDAPGTPSPMNPGNGAWTGSLQPTLEVYPATDIDGDTLSYEFKIYQASNQGDDYELITSGSSDTTYWQLDATLNQSGYYYWHARAIDEHGLAGEWSDIVMFFADDDGINDPPEISLKRLVYGRGNIETIHMLENGHAPEKQKNTDNNGSDNQSLVRIKWHDHDPDSNASISLYYDTDRYGENGVLITGNIDEDPDGIHDHYNWDVSELTPGIYFVYAIIDDGYSSSVAYSENAVIVGDGGGLPYLEFNSSESEQEQKAYNYIKLKWHDLDVDSNALISLYYDADDAGFDGMLIAGGLEEDPDGLKDHYYWNVTSLAEGKYHVYAIIDDGMNSYAVYRDKPVEVEHYRNKKGKK